MAAVGGVGHALLHVHALGQLLLAGHLLVALAHLRRVLEHVLAELPWRQEVAFVGLLLHDSLGARHGGRGVGAVLVGHVFHDAGHRLHDLLGGGCRAALKQAVGQEHARATCDNALLVVEVHGEVARCDEGVGVDFLRGVGQRCIVAHHVAHSLAALVVHVVDVGLLAGEQRDGEEALASAVERGVFHDGGGLGHGHVELVGGVLRGGGHRVALKVGHEQVARLAGLPFAQLSVEELGNLAGERHEVTGLEVVLKLAGEHAVLLELAVLVLGAALGAAQVALHERLDEALSQVELAGGVGGACSLEVEDVQDGVVDVHRRFRSCGRWRLAMSSARLFARG